MAGKGGGAWKVAYADFVTAMMAFFLVMWICSMDQKVKKAVADYFGDPNSAKNGISKSPNRTGALFDRLQVGSVPEVDNVAMGRGRISHSPNQEKSAVTKLVNDWLHADPKVYDQWREKARKLRDQAQQAQEAGDQANGGEKAAGQKLARQLKDEIMRGIPEQAKGLYQDLLFEVMSEVNWSEIAEDLLAR